jgi:hypothetical protein
MRMGNGDQAAVLAPDRFIAVVAASSEHQQKRSHAPYHAWNKRAPMNEAALEQGTGRNSKKENERFTEKEL